jgi:hypothetical protein
MNNGTGTRHLQLSGLQPCLMSRARRKRHRAQSRAPNQLCSNGCILRPVWSHVCGQVSCKRVSCHNPIGLQTCTRRGELTRSKYIAATGQYWNALGFLSNHLPPSKEIRANIFTTPPMHSGLLSWPAVSFVLRFAKSKFNHQPHLYKIVHSRSPSPSYTYASFIIDCLLAHHHESKGASCTISLAASLGFCMYHVKRQKYGDDIVNRYYPCGRRLCRNGVCEWESRNGPTAFCIRCT